MVRSRSRCPLKRLGKSQQRIEYELQEISEIYKNSAFQNIFNDLDSNRSTSIITFNGLIIAIYFSFRVVIFASTSVLHET